MRRGRTWIVVAMLAGIGYVVGIWLGPRSKNLGEKAYPAPPFTLQGFDQKQVSLADFRGRVVLVDFWATWCAPCLAELPDLKTLFGRYRARGFTILAVSLDEPEQTLLVKRFVRQRGVPYPVLLAGGMDRVPEGYDVQGLPSAYLVDQEGRVVKVYSGQKRITELDRDITSLLKKGQAS